VHNEKEKAAPAGAMTLKRQVSKVDVSSTSLLLRGAFNVIFSQIQDFLYVSKSLAEDQELCTSGNVQQFFLFKSRDELGIECDKKMQQKVMKDIHVFKSNEDNSATEFRWYSMEKKIESFTLYCDGSWGINAFQANLTDGTKGEIVGKIRSSDNNFDLKLPNNGCLDKIRIRADSSGPRTPYEFEFVSDAETTRHHTRQSG